MWVICGDMSIINCLEIDNNANNEFTETALPGCTIAFLHTRISLRCAINVRTNCAYFVSSIWPLSTA